MIFILRLWLIFINFNSTDNNYLNRHTYDVWEIPRKNPKKRHFFNKLTSQELDVQIFSWLSTVLPYEIPLTINELRVQVKTNNLGKMQYFPLFDRINIVLDQQLIKGKQINKRLHTIHSNIYRAISALLFSSFKFKASSEGLKITKAEGWGHAWRNCHSHERFFGRVAYWVKVLLRYGLHPHFYRKIFILSPLWFLCVCACVCVCVCVYLCACVWGKKNYNR